MTKPTIQKIRKSEAIDRKCVICGKKLKITLFSDKKYKGGEYFGKCIPLYSKKEWEKMMKGGTRKGKLGGMTINILKYDAKPYRILEYWECKKCYNK